MREFIFASSPEGFDSHISNSIRGYNELIDDIVDISDFLMYLVAESVYLLVIY